MNLWPTRKQWNSWTPLTKVGFIGGWASIVGLPLAILLYFLSTSGNKTINSGNVTQNVGANNNGNVALVNNSPNSSITQQIGNPPIKPYVVAEKILSINQLESGIYRTKASVTVGYSGNKVSVGYPRFRSQAEDTVCATVDFGQMVVTPGGLIKYKTILITFSTFKKIQESDLQFKAVEDSSSNATK